MKQHAPTLILTDQIPPSPYDGYTASVRAERANLTREARRKDREALAQARHMAQRGALGPKRNAWV